MKKLLYGIKISLLSDEDGGGYLVEVPDLPGCFTDGDTVEESVAKVEDAINGWIETAKKIGRKIPEPSYHVEEANFSGKLSIRIPKDLHKKLSEEAAEQGISLNSLIQYFLSIEIEKHKVLRGFSKHNMLQFVGQFSPRESLRSTKELWNDPALEEVHVLKGAQY